MSGMTPAQRNHLTRSTYDIGFNAGCQAVADVIQATMAHPALATMTAREALEELAAVCVTIAADEVAK